MTDIIDTIDTIDTVDTIADTINDTIYDVLIKINSENCITAIDSSAFVDGYGWIKIDEGSQYRLAQHNYLGKDITDNYGRYNYRYINDTVEEIPEEEKPPVPVPVPVPTNEELASAVAELADIIMGGMM